MSDPAPNNHSTDAPWVRIIKMIVVAFGYQVTSILIGAVAVVQVVLMQTGSGPNERLRALGCSLAIYQAQNARFFTFASDAAPFPFADWPTDLNQ